MKLGKIRHIVEATVFAAALSAAGLFGSQANAQAGFQGKLALPYEVHWGQATLPSGDYLLSFEHITMTMPAKLVIRDAKTLRIVAYEDIGIRDDSVKGTSALLVGRQGTQRVVYSLRIAELGTIFVYERPPAQGGALEEARQTQAIPVLVAKK